MYHLAKQGSGFINDVLKKYGYRMLHIFGDTDAGCSLTGTRKWIKSLKWERSSAWEPWIEDDQLFGFTRRYGNYTLTTIHG